LISALLGGVGLFLLGMILLTEGMRAAAGEALRDLLARLTGGPAASFATGVGLTAVVQSSSATILTTIGFVSAGLLTFSQAVGVVLGASVGTTSTAWLVAFLGLKYSISVVALPVVGIGALMRLLGSGRVAAVGLALAGFGLIFVGIDTLQLGMETLGERVDLSRWHGEGLGGRALLVLLGVGMTVVMQSSSAAVATTLAALAAGTIDLPQAAALVIGQNAGTTVTAAMASIGASVPARRTALAQILFNLFAAALAFLALPIFLAALRPLLERGVTGPEAIALFHTAFNLAAVGMVLPFVSAYAGLVERWVPERSASPTRHLDPSLRTIPEVAVEAARRAVLGIAAELLETVRTLLAQPAGRELVDARLARMELALVEVRDFLGGVRSTPGSGPSYDHHLGVLHAVDHLERLASAVQASRPVSALAAEPALGEIAAELAERLSEVARWQDGDFAPARVMELEALSLSMAARRRSERPLVLERATEGGTDPRRALRQLDAIRWLDRIAYHLWRALFHLTGPAAGEEPRDDSK
jgi:phosphate:Na+ symporter